MRADNPDRQPDPIPEDAWGPGYHLWKSIESLLAQRGPEGTTSLVRVASHLVILLVAVVVLMVSRLELPRWDIAEAKQAAAPVQEAETAPLTTDSEVAAATTLV